MVMTRSAMVLLLCRRKTGGPRGKTCHEKRIERVVESEVLRSAGEVQHGLDLGMSEAWKCKCMVPNIQKFSHNVDTPFFLLRYNKVGHG